MPLYRHLSVADMLHLTGNLNLRFDTAYARRRLSELGIDHKQKAGKLSGGQQAQLALTLALARHPRLLVLDEPTAPLDPVARHDFMATVLTAMADDGVSVVLSSHMLAELERVTDYLVLISRRPGSAQRRSREATRHTPSGQRRDPRPTTDLSGEVIESTTMGAQIHQLIRLTPTDAPLPPDCEARPVGLEELALAYLRETTIHARTEPGRSDPMTALSMAPLPSVRPVPWSRLGWVVWRRYRTMLTATVGILAVIAVYLVITGEQMRSAYHAATACKPTDSTACMYKFQRLPQQLRLARFHRRRADVPAGHRRLFRRCTIAGPRTRNRHVPLRLDARRRTDALGDRHPGVGCNRRRDHHDRVRSVDHVAEPAPVRQRHHASSAQTIFPETGLAAAGWALAGFATAVLAGLLWRRVVPAIATAFAACFGLEYLGATYRTHYLTPLTTTSLDQPAKALTISQWWTKSGIHVSSNQVASALSGVGAPFNESGGKITSTAGSSTGAGTNIDPVQYLLQHGYTQVTSYQPDSRYWPLQWIEFGWLTALALAFLGIAFWLLRRRPA